MKNFTEKEKEKLEKKLHIIDMRNGEIFIKFNNNYACCFDWSDSENIIDSFKAFSEDSQCTKHWDGNDIKHWSECWNSDTTDQLDVEDVLRIISMIDE